MNSLNNKWKVHLVHALWISGFFLLLELFGLLFKLPFLTFVWKTANFDGINNSTKITLIAFLAVAAAHVLIFALNFFLLLLFRPWIWSYAFLFVGYTLLYCFLYYPQLIEDLVFWSSYLIYLDPLRNIYVLYAIVISLLFVLAKPMKWTTLNLRLGIQFVTLLVFGYFLVVFNNPYRARNQALPTVKRSGSTAGKPDIIFLGIDGLRPDTFAEILEKGDYPFTKKFLTSSHQYAKSYAPIARTHPVYHSMFWGKNPAELQIRTNNHPLSLKTDESLQGSLLSKFKSEGYRISISLNDSSFSYYTKGKIFDDVTIPQPGYHMISLPRILKDRLFFAWFNNKIGQWMAPDIIGNGAFSITHWPQAYQETVVDKLTKGRAHKDPQLMFFHNVKIHWPGSNQYPYLTIGSKNEVRRPRYDSSLVTDITENPGTNLSSVRERYIEIYKLGVIQLLDQYIEPLLRAFDNSGALNETVLVLFSDHGESFYGKGLLPLKKSQGHGSIISMGEDSNHNFLAIRYPSGDSAIHDQEVSLSQVLPIIRSRLQLDEPSQMETAVPLESDYWPGEMFPGSFYQNQLNLSRSLFDPSGVVFIASDAIEKSMKEKERGFVKEGVKYSLLPSEYGYYLQASVTQNQANKPMPFEDALSEIMRVFAKDQSQNFIPKLEFRSRTKDKAYLVTSPGQGTAATLQSAIEDLHARLHPSRALRTFQLLLESGEATDSEKALSKHYTMKICYTFPQLFRSRFRPEVGETDPYHSILSAFRCATALGDKELKTQLAQQLFKRFYPQMNVRDRIMVEQYLLVDYFYYADIADTMNVRAALNSKAFASRAMQGNVRNEYESLNKVLLGVEAESLSLQELSHKMGEFFQQARHFKDFGFYGLLDSWYSYLTFGAFHSRNPNKKRSLLFYEHILKNDPYLSMEMLRHTQNQLTALLPKNKRPAFVQQTFALWADNEAPEKREAFVKLWLSYIDNARVADGL